jgi:HK97 family phage major capsid protein
MPYNSLISRADAEARVREVVSDIMMNTLPTESAAMQMFRRVNVPTGTTKFPVVSALPTAYWVTGDTGLKQTTEMAWDAKYITIEELAAIVVVPHSPATRGHRPRAGCRDLLRHQCASVVS